MKRFYFDIETDGLLDTMTQIHCLVLRDTKGNSWSYADQPGHSSIAEGLKHLGEGDIIIGHNVLGFDIPAIQLIYPDWKPKNIVTDTLILSRMAFPDIFGHKRVNKNLDQVKKGQWMSHGLAAWGARLGCDKDKYTDEEAALIIAQDPHLFPSCPKKALKEAKKLVWETWNIRMHNYCIQDVVVTEKVYLFLKQAKMTTRSVQVEHGFKKLMVEQEAFGWEFNHQGAQELYALLAVKEAELHQSFLERWPGWYRAGKVTAPKKARSVKTTMPTGDVTIPRYGKKGNELSPYVGPVKVEYCPTRPYTPITWKDFNPGSRADCISILKRHFGWKPSKWTEKGMEKMDEAILKGLKDEIPMAADLIDFYTIRKRLGQIADGRNGWLKLAKPVPGTEGRYRMHGSVNTMGTVTHRCTHSRPNQGQVPAASDNMPYGKECRELFTVPEGWMQVGSDADALEMRLLGHYLKPYDKGDMITAIESGNKEDGTDPHSVYRDRIGVDIVGEGKTGRDKAKTHRYGKLYGAGFLKQGKIIDPTLSDAAATAMGRKVAKRLEAAGEMSGVLDKAVKKKAERTGHITALDGRIMPVRHAFAALNTLLQSGGAIYMKYVLVEHARALGEAGLLKRRDWHYIGNIHDEFQAQVRPECVDKYREITLATYLKVGEELGIACPMRGSVDVGKNWADCH